jgi:hypothetical protein
LTDPAEMLDQFAIQERWMFDTHLFADVIRERLTESGLEAEVLREDAVRLTQRADALEQFCELLYDALNRLPER